MNFILQISSKCGQGGGEVVKKSKIFADVINECSLTERSVGILIRFCAPRRHKATRSSSVHESNFIFAIC